MLLLQYYIMCACVAASAALTAASLLSGTPRSQHDLAEGVFAAQRDRLLMARSGYWGGEGDEGARLLRQHRARLRSVGGAFAGSWVRVMPVARWACALPADYWAALCQRLGVAFEGLGGVRCGGCAHVHDRFAFHPGGCRGGNRGGMWSMYGACGMMGSSAVCRWPCSSVRRPFCPFVGRTGLGRQVLWPAVRGRARIGAAISSCRITGPRGRM